MEKKSDDNVTGKEFREQLPTHVGIKESNSFKSSGIDFTIYREDEDRYQLFCNTQPHKNRPIFKKPTTAREVWMGMLYHKRKHISGIDFTIPEFLDKGVVVLKDGEGKYVRYPKKMKAFLDNLYEDDDIGMETG